MRAAEGNRRADVEYDYDYLIVGSGFGGAVTALRLAEKGWRVAVLEQGETVDAQRIKAAKRHPLTRLAWLPRAGQTGYCAQHMFKHVGILAGVGVGGGSLVWGAVMLPPKPSFYDAPVWEALGLDMRAELAPHLERAKRMLGVTTNPRVGRHDEYLKQAAIRMGRGDTWGSVPQAIDFGRPAGDADGKPPQARPDPYFDGRGPDRTPCRFCGECLAGCEFGSKNSLDKNYLYLAEAIGVEIRPGCRVEQIRPLPDQVPGYEVAGREKGSPITLRCRRLVLSAGVIGTLDLLMRARDQHASLPHVSAQCGQFVRTNSEALTGVFSRDVNARLLDDGAAISSDFYADPKTHITQNRIAPALAPLLRATLVPMVDEARPRVRMLKTLLAMVFRPLRWLPAVFGRNWSQRITTLTVMQNDDSGVELRLQRSMFGRWTMTSGLPKQGRRAPSYLPIANQATRAYAQAADGIPLSSLFEALGGKAMTAHILGGCPMSADASSGVINAEHEVHGHPGLYVVDGSAIPANLGVNPSLTIAALAERFAALQPAAKAADNRQQPSRREHCEETAHA